MRARESSNGRRAEIIESSCIRGCNRIVTPYVFLAAEVFFPLIKFCLGRNHPDKTLEVSVARLQPIARDSFIPVGWCPNFDSEVALSPNRPIRRATQASLRTRATGSEQGTLSSRMSADFNQ
jgi:hypothetical protein